MKSCKSTLRKAAMAAMLAGAITTTGGVKAAESPLSMKDHPVVEDIWKRVKEEPTNIYDDLVWAFGSLSAEEINNLLGGLLSTNAGGHIEQDASDIMNGLLERLNDEPKIEKDRAVEILLNSFTDSLQNRVAFEESLREKKIQLEKDKARAIQISGELANKLSQAEADRDKAQAEADRLSQAVDSLGRLTNSAKRELTEKLAEIDQLTADKVKAETDLEAANANITTLQEELAGAKASYDKLSEEKAAADQALAEANARVSELEQQAASANARVADLEVQLAAKTAELDVVKADKAELEAKVKELQDMLQQKDRSNADLQANIERLKQELADKFKDQAQPRAKTPQASNSAAKQKASKPTAKPAGQLPSTGEATANPFFTAAAVAIMTGAGLVTVMPKRQKN
ncbi:protective antigen-like protein, fibrinogen- and Ig-binding protein precursor [Streptococcus equi subsp. zooepidemicus Sz16]|uniref:LPXTG cell wall anchor domain-containing protein n=1 Tax=Streptococcus equi TaxID=1336 RepID=UPI0005BB613D|nr:LPXTG cell wall anchor domain-containing protein [Streptococcus equi]VTP91216.1 fibrinogen- and Ig-binding protein precursor [Streptococcus equi subsp. zooepidemicus]KIS10358.1 protective antigen-like protein, fibrinogen- and Ig-binding protein precursor [Streptococcus equi subsp. zooepidemicus Sz16]KIS20789.1 protective antigen-like protein, fibrinogen- and Ig-binding protein precursor [Streptococcus equi subsp. zooepidemicus SzAM35]HEK9996296.1 LPXTG cell wall anchor domain-containing prot